jgi:hypothetical protein
MSDRQIDIQTEKKRTDRQKKFRQTNIYDNNDNNNNKTTSTTKLGNLVMNGLSLTRGIFLCNNNNDKNNSNDNNDNKYNNKNTYIYNNLPWEPNCEQTLFNEVYFSISPWH